MSKEKQELWRKRIKDYHLSGLSGARWCAEHSIPEHNFWYWKKRLGKTNKKKEVASTWVPMVVDDSALCETMLTVRIGVVEIEVKSGYDETLLKDVARTLMSLC